MSPSPTVDSERGAAYLSERYDLNIEMWKHYDNLRQEKNHAFLQAQAFLIAALALTIDPKVFVTSDTRPLAICVSAVGFLLGLAWLTLQRRNEKYIRFHQDHSKYLECAVVRRLPADGDLADYMKYDKNGKEQLEKSWWPPSRWSSNTIDASLPCVTTLFWIATIVILIIKA